MIPPAILDLTFVLVGTTHTGNIGAAARAMKNMGFYRLRLVNTCSHRSDEAIARASGAHDVLDAAESFTSLEDAVADAQVVIGTTARQRQLAVPVESCRVMAESLREMAETASAPPVVSESDETASVSASSAQRQTASPATVRIRAAVVFGRERSGLSNEELDCCTRLLHIPCNPAFSSLNLGSAVQVVAYECALALAAGPAGVDATACALPLNGDASIVDAGHDARLVSHAARAAHGSAPANEPPRTTRAEQITPATSGAMQHFFRHLETVMVETGFLDPDNPRLLMRRLKRYFERNRPTVNELNILRGILAATQESRSKREHGKAD